MNARAETTDAADRALQPMDRAVASAPDAGALIQMIERAALNPSVDINKMERLYEMHEKALARSAKLSFVRAFAIMKPQLPTITERGAILNSSGKVQSSYAEWEDINDAIGPLLTANGFTLSFRPGAAPDGKVTVTGILRHIDGHEEEATVTLPMDPSGSKNAVQSVGSSLSYGKRYATIALLNITSRAPADKDDDGRRSSLSEAAQHAIADINLSDSLDDLRKWKEKHYEGVAKVITEDERKEIVALYNRRSKAFRERAASTQGDGFPGDRSR